MSRPEDGITDNDLWWAAGYFDARGGIHISKTQVRVIFTDKDYEVLAKFTWITDLTWMPLTSPPRGHKKDDPATTNTLLVTARPQVRKLITTFRPMVVRKDLIKKMDQALKWIEDKDGSYSRLQLSLPGMSYPLVKVVS